MITLLHGIALALHLATAFALGGALARGRSPAPRGTVWPLLGAVLAHLTGLALYTARFEELPLVGLAPSLSTLALAMGVFLLGAQWLREARSLGIVLVPLMVLLLGVALALGIAPSGEPMAFSGWWFSLHVLMAFAGYAGLAVAFAAGLLYLIQLRELKGKHFGRIFRFLPSLDSLEAAWRRALAVGFPALTLALALGWGWTVRFRHTFEIGEPKVLWAIFTWAVMAAALGIRGGGPRRQRWSALVTVVGFAVVVISYVMLRGATMEGRAFF